MEYNTGSCYVEHPAIIHVSGTAIGEVLIVGSDFVVNYCESNC